MYITRLASNEIFSPSNKIHREVGRAKDLSAPRYQTVHILTHLQYFFLTLCNENCLFKPSGYLNQAGILKCILSDPSPCSQKHAIRQLQSSAFSGFVGIFIPVPCQKFTYIHILHFVPLSLFVIQTQAKLDLCFTVHHQCR